MDMNKSRLTNVILMILFSFVFTTTVDAGVPPWTFEPVSGYPPTVSITPEGSAIVKYIVVNRSHLQHTLQMKPIQGIASSGCTASLSYGESCTLTLAVTGSQLKANINGGPVLCDKSNPNQCYQPSQGNALSIHLIAGVAILQPSSSTLALSINCPTSCSSLANAQLMGHAREISVQNTGTAPATNVSVSAPGLPSNTQMTTTCQGTLGVGEICKITVTPGEIASSDSNGHACTQGTLPVGDLITITADGGLLTQVTAYVLGYGCIYQGGFIYSVDDTTSNGQAGTCSTPPCSGSMGGKTAATTDTYAGTDGTSTGTPNWDGGSSTDVGSSTYENDPSGANDGSANTATIISQLNLVCSPNSDVVACRCNVLSVNQSGTSPCIGENCFTGWYLPAICELGPNTVSPFDPPPACTSGSTNIRIQLFENISITNPLGLSGFYWSSTEDSNLASTAS